jgi:uncharacterized OB-fold protein
MKVHYLTFVNNLQETKLEMVLCTRCEKHYFPYVFGVISQHSVASPYSVDWMGR